MRGQRAWVIGAALVAVALAALLAPWASPWPDGLERVAENLGFSEATDAAPPVPSPLPDYSVPVLGEGRFSTASAGVIGTLLVLVLAWWWGRLLSTQKRRREAAPRQEESTAP